ncbi:MAG: leucine--tRNA ligase [Flavobacteriales bacterium]|nr:leucine--tRNA ligase [Flavobacteriales bacterium]
MEYNFREIEANWRKFWAENKTFAAKDQSDLPKYYVLDMFPYPSGAGLHVGHPLGYIASDIFARYKRAQGFNVLHPMGYDSFGLPAEQYAIQTGQHPRITTENNVARYRDQLDKIGFSFDWDREVRTSSPEYYKWTQWIFKQLFNAYYDETQDKAVSISELIKEFETNGNANVNATTDFEGTFTADEWNAYSEKEKEACLQEYRLAFLADSWVNWCPALGTVLANDEIVNGKSERGNHPVEQKLMRQWSMRIKAYAERLLTGLEKLDWTDSIKDIQRNWIGKSVGASVNFKVDFGSAQSTGNDQSTEKVIEVFTTRPDTIFGVSFMVLAPEHPYVDEITTDEYKDAVANYKKEASLKSERDRQADVKNITGQFTGAYAIHPFSGEKVQIWIGDYVLASYGTGAVMAVPCGDQRDWDFAKHFGIEIINIFEDVDISEAAYTEKEGTIANSDFLTGLPVKKAIKRAIHEIETRGIGKGKTNYRLRDAVFSRQRYWGEPFPVYFKDDIPYLVEDDQLPITLPDVDKYLPTEEGEPPLARATKEAWGDQFQGDRMDYNTMPGWAGSSWYFLRYMDPQNENEFVAKEKVEYWKNVDLYIGGSEHATGHLLYARFWTKFLYDMGHIPFDEPFQKMINQGMILGRSSFVYRKEDSNEFVSNSKKKGFKTTPIHVDISMVENDVLDIEAFKNWRPEYANATFILEDDGTYICGSEVEKMSKSKYNVQTPDELVEKFGADTLRMYEMFLGPLEQSKPWDTQGINGVHNFLRKVWRLVHDRDGNIIITEGEPTKDALKTLHKTIKKVGDDLERFSFNTGVSNFMICANELTDQKCHNKAIIEQFVVLLSSYAPHMCEELWVKLGNEPGTVGTQPFPTFNPDHLIEANHKYPVSFNGKMRFMLELPTNLSKEEIEKEVLAHENSQKWLDGNTPKKVIVVPGRIVNIVV